MFLVTFKKLHMIDVATYVSQYEAFCKKIVQTNIETSYVHLQYTDSTNNNKFYNINE